MVSGENRSSLVVEVGTLPAALLIILTHELILTPFRRLSFSLTAISLQSLMVKGGGVDQLTANKIENSWDMVKEQVGLL